MRSTVFRQNFAEEISRLAPEAAGQANGTTDGAVDRRSRGSGSFEAQPHRRSESHANSLVTPSALSGDVSGPQQSPLDGGYVAHTYSLNGNSRLQRMAYDGDMGAGNMQSPLQRHLGESSRKQVRDPVHIMLMRFDLISTRHAPAYLTKQSNQSMVLSPNHQESPVSMADTVAASRQEATAPTTPSTGIDGTPQNSSVASRYQPSVNDGASARISQSIFSSKTATEGNSAGNRLSRFVSMRRKGTGG